MAGSRHFNNARPRWLGERLLSAEYAIRASARTTSVHWAEAISVLNASSGNLAPLAAIRRAYAIPNFFVTCAGV